MLHTTQLIGDVRSPHVYLQIYNIQIYVRTYKLQTDTHCTHIHEKHPHIQHVGLVEDTHTHPALSPTNIIYLSTNPAPSPPALHSHLHQYTHTLHPLTLHPHLQRSYLHQHVGVVEEVRQHVVDGRLGHDEFLQVVGTELLSVHVDGREEDRLHLVVTQFICRLMGRDQGLFKGNNALQVISLITLPSHFTK